MNQTQSTHQITSSNRGIHPGAILRKELEAIGLYQSQLATRMQRPFQAINEIIRCKKRITADTAIQLEQELGIEANYWLYLQAEYDLQLARNAILKASLL